MHQVQQLENTVAERRESASAAMREPVEHHANLRAIQGVFAVVDQRFAGPSMSSSTVGASSSTPDDPEANPSAKRARRS